MKAKYKEKFDRYILSIGMIVKNEEKNLRACLEALKPLREAVPSELIIVDTGSEDATIQIAKEYTDKVYSFEWINDFAAARNYGVDRATGKWFMYLDADEQLAFPDELIQFLNTESEWKQYCTADITIHNFLNKEKDQYTEFLGTRIFRMDTRNRFYGAIHEVPMNIAPIKKLLKSRLDHYGYLYETDEEKERKFQRNNILLEIELEKKPDDLRLICLYAASCPDEKRMDLLEHGRELAKKNPEHYYFPNVYWRTARELTRLKKYEQVVELAEEYNQLTTQEHVGEIELVYHLVNANYYLERYEELLAACERYLDLYNRYQDGSLIEQDNACDECERVYPAAYHSIYPQMAYALEGLGQYEEAIDSLLKCDLNNVDQRTDAFCILLIVKAVCEAERLDWLIKADEWVNRLQLSDERTQEYVMNFVDVYLQKADVFDFYTEEIECDSVFADLLQVGNAIEGTNWTKVTQRLEECPTQLRKYGIIAAFLALKNKKRLCISQSVNAEMIQQWNIRMAERTIDLHKPLLEYLSYANEKNIREMSDYFWTVDLEINVLRRCEEEYRLPLAKHLINDFSWYINHLYNKDILTPEGICVLPSAHRFAYWCGQALASREQGDTSGYIKLLGEASRACPEMAKVAKLLIQEVRDNDETLKAQREQQELAKKIKGIIEGMILAGNKEDAQSILAQYELIAPGDPDIPSLKAAVLQQPALSET